MSRTLGCFTLLAAIIVVLCVSLASPPHVYAGSAECTADATTVVVGTAIQFECSGFDPNIIVNSYVVEETGFSEVGKYDYAACLDGANAEEEAAKTNEQGVATFTWYTQDGTGSCLDTTLYKGYANQLGTYTLVVQELDGRGGIKNVATLKVTLVGNGKTYSGASLWTDSPALAGGSMALYGSGFGANETVNVWFTRPQECSGIGEWYYTGISAFSPYSWNFAGIEGSDAVKTDSSGKFTAIYRLSDTLNPTSTPCLGSNWHVTAHALGSGLGAEFQFAITGNHITETALIWLDETSVPSIGQKYDCEPEGCGIGVHVHGSGFPAGANVNCWLTRPDGTAYKGFSPNSPSAVKVGADGTFSFLAVTYTSENTLQGEQPGEWAVTCGTADGKYAGIARFLVYPLPLIDP